jgi:magnesium chelatase family protein
MIGPPGAGKSMLAQRLPSILPPLEPAEMLEVSMIRSLAGDLAGGRIGRARPFRAPHHSASMAALVGGGSRPRPGEVALAHLGVLFLDELPEFHPQVLDALRQPLESGETVIARANHRITYPSRIQLVAAMNPCRCGRAGEPGFSCRQGRSCAERYQARISGPLLDRIDIQIEVPALPTQDLSSTTPGEPSPVIKARVERARARMIARQGKENARLAAAEIEQYCLPDQAGIDLLNRAIMKFGLSARGYDRILKLARSIADLAHAEKISAAHLAEALRYRTLPPT